MHTQRHTQTHLQRISISRSLCEGSRIASLDAMIRADSGSHQFFLESLYRHAAIRGAPQSCILSPLTIHWQKRASMKSTAQTSALYAACRQQPSPRKCLTSSHFVRRARVPYYYAVEFRKKRPYYKKSNRGRWGDEEPEEKEDEQEA